VRRRPRSARPRSEKEKEKENKKRRRSGAKRAAPRCAERIIVRRGAEPPRWTMMLIGESGSRCRAQHLVDVGHLGETD
jgi:hypothetical protein